MTMNVSITINHDKNGIEIRFAEKPSDDILYDIKSKGWRWSLSNQCWWKRYSDDNYKFAKSICNNEGSNG